MVFTLSHVYIIETSAILFDCFFLATSTTISCVGTRLLPPPVPIVFQPWPPINTACYLMHDNKPPFPGYKMKFVSLL